jgi:hypothetical protein
MALGNLGLISGPSGLRPDLDVAEGQTIAAALAAMIALDGAMRMRTRDAGDHLADWGRVIRVLGERIAAWVRRVRLLAPQRRSWPCRRWLPVPVRHVVTSDVRRSVAEAGVLADPGGQASFPPGSPALAAGQSVGLLTVWQPLYGGIPR